MAAEGVGTALLVAVVVGSGIMAERLSTNPALTLLANTLATGAGLVALILAFGAVSGAHLNPAVTISAAVKGDFAWRDVVPYVSSQLVGGIAGVMTAHVMFELPALDISRHERSGFAQFLSEGVATFALVGVIAGCARSRPAAIPFAVGAYITAAYWFTASTSFANPAVAVARSLTNTFTGIRPVDVPAFIAAELCGALAATLFFRWLQPASTLRTQDLTRAASENP
jgi:glycerol uptake facilitator-like aquaporin